MQKHGLSRQGFTLVELSIVLVIIGLLIGGILIGQSLIDSAKINAQIRQLQQFDAATNAFIAKFGTYPGDAPLPTVAGPIGGGPPPQGNNNGIVSDYAGLRCMGGSRGYTYECANFFAHLTQFGGMSGNYAVGSYPQTCGKGKPFPDAAMKTNEGSACIFASQNPSGELFWIIDRDNMNPANNPGDPWQYDRALTAPQAMAIDQKIDDGLALSGDVAMISIFGTLSQDGTPEYPKYARSFDTSAYNQTCIANTTTGRYHSTVNIMQFSYNKKGGCALQVKARSYK